MKQSRILALLLGLAIIIFLIAQDLVWSGKLEVKTNFLKLTPFFSVLKPQDLIIRYIDTNYIKAQPVYFDLYLPRDFQEAKIEMEFKDEIGYKIFIGPNIKNFKSDLPLAETNSSFAFGNWDLKPLIDLPSASSSYKISSISFNLADKNINKGKLRFMIYIPDLKDENKGIFLKNIKITLIRQPIWRENLLQNLSNYFNYVKNQH